MNAGTRWPLLHSSFIVQQLSFVHRLPFPALFIVPRSAFIASAIIPLVITPGLIYQPAKENRLPLGSR